MVVLRWFSRSLFRSTVLVPFFAAGAFPTFRNSIGAFVTTVPTGRLGGHGTDDIFRPAHAFGGRPWPSTLFSSIPQDNDMGEVGVSGTTSDNDVRLLLTQCSIQSFMFLCTQMRDPHLIKWLDSFTKPTTGPFGEGAKGYGDADGLTLGGEKEEGSSSAVENDKKLSSRLLYYHGISGLNSTIFPTWDTYFRSLLEEPGTQFVVESNNRLVREFTIDIEPASICSRILSVREQIAKEWARDLDVVVARGAQIISSYNEKRSRKLEEPDEKDAPGDGLGNNWVRVRPLSSSSDAVFERMNPSFLEWDPGEDSGPAPSPLRKGNFDLLVNLATKESIKRVLASGGSEGDSDAGGEKEGTGVALSTASIGFLRSFYEDRAEYYFGGKSKRYHIADEFLEQLMTAPPQMVTVRKRIGGDIPVSIEPVAIAEVILKERERVAKEWKEVAIASPEEHSEIRRLQLNRMMGL